MTTPHQAPTYLGSALPSPSGTLHHNDEHHYRLDGGADTTNGAFSDSTQTSFTKKAKSSSASGSSSSRIDAETKEATDDQHRPLPDCIELVGSRLSRGRGRLGSAGLTQQTSRASRVRSSSPHFPSSALALTETREKDPQAIYIEWDQPHDPENPFDWATGRKWRLVFACFLFTMATSITATGYVAAGDQVTREFSTSYEVFLLGNTLFLFAVAFTPLALAPLSEVYGRTPIYLAAAFLFTVLYIPQALAPNISAILATRLFQGMCGSVGNSMVGGSVSDVFPAASRGLPMSIFALLVFTGQGIGPLASAYIAEYRSWRWIFAYQGFYSCLAFVLMIFVGSETRGPVLLSRRAQKLTKETGKLHRTRADDERASFLIMVRTSLTRPMVYLLTEPVVTFFSLWIGFLWGCIFLLVESVPIVFSQYGWSQGQIGLVFLTLPVGALLGCISNIHQEKLFARAARRCGGRPPPEARLYWACAGGIVFAIGFFWYGWGGRQEVHPVVPILGLICINAGCFPVYLSVFSYMADAYERYSSSALAAQSWLRNVLAGTFALFAKGMYDNLSPPVASSVLGAIAFALSIVPFLLLRYGAWIRSHSRVAKAMEREEKEAEEMARIAAEKGMTNLQMKSGNRNVGRAGAGAAGGKDERESKRADEKSAQIDLEKDTLQRADANANADAPLDKGQEVVKCEA